MKTPRRSQNVKSEFLSQRVRLLAFGCQKSLLPCAVEKLPLAFLALDFNLTHQNTASNHCNTYKIHPQRAIPTMYADCLPGASVTVRVNGVPLTEHATENSDLSATTFVEAVAGAEFDVSLDWDDHFAYRNPADRIKFTVYVDGKWIRSLVLPMHLRSMKNPIVEGPYETNNGVTTVKRLTFAQHASSMQDKYQVSDHLLIRITADNKADDSMMKQLSHVGQIKVTLQRCREAGLESAANCVSNFKGIDDHAVPEKAFKGRSISSHTK